MFGLIAFINPHHHTAIINFMLMNFILHVNYISNSPENAKQLINEQ